MEPVARTIMNASSAADLEKQATRERERLQNSVSELAHRVRESVDPKRAVRTHLLFSATVCAVAGLVFGYMVAVPFTASRR